MSKKYKHMNLDDRVEIQEGLDKGMSFKAIAEQIGKNQTTISKEVKRHLRIHENYFVKTDVCCPKLLKAPFVCNGCTRRSRSSCPYQRQLYQAKKAQADYEALLVESREGTPLNKEEFYRTEHIVCEAIKQGQHIYHILQTYHLPVSKSTVYRHINQGYYSIGRIDLPRAPKFKARRSKKNEYVPKAAKRGRTHEEFLAYIEQSGTDHYVELDTVIGRIGGKVIMTLHFTAFNFMVALLLENKSATEAADKIMRLKHLLKENGLSFGKLIPVLLTDNGGEFSFVQDFENDENGNTETKLFFCDPLSPYQKPRIEKNHTLFRDIVPKGTSFDQFTQDTVNTIFSHVNSVKRESFHGKTAYELFSFAYSEKLASILGISRVAPEKVIQTPRLLK